MRKTITADEILSGLRTRIDSSSLRRVALELGVSTSYLSDIMMGRRMVGKKLARALGYERRVERTTAVTFTLKEAQNGRE